MSARIFCSHCGNLELFFGDEPETFYCAVCGTLNARAKLPALAALPHPEFTAHPELLSTILEEMKVKRLALKDLEYEIQNLEYRAAAVGEWLAKVDSQNEAQHAARTSLDLQYRLFDQLQILKAGVLDLVDCDSENENSLACFIGQTFAAFGWNVQRSSGKSAPHCGEEVTFMVGPGDIGYPVAALHLGFTGAGFRLSSRMDITLATGSAKLFVHRISTLPRSLPAPKPRPREAVEADEFRKSA